MEFADKATFAYLAGGVIVVEYIFNYAGICGALPEEQDRAQPLEGVAEIVKRRRASPPAAT